MLYSEDLDKLSSCRFCGGRPTFLIQISSFNDQKAVRVYCRKCEKGVLTTNEQQALERWAVHMGFLPIFT